MPLSTIDTASISGLGYGFKNRIINGAMVIDQRNAGASVTITTSNQYTLDRWQGVDSVGSKYSVQQNAGSVTPPVGFATYLGVTSLSAYPASSGDYRGVRQSLEGFNTSDLAWGTANAATVTLSFWVRSSLTGTFGGAINNSAYNYSYPFSFVISSANTWEQKSVTITGPTSGTWIGATNGVGLAVIFDTGSGSSSRGTANSWSANGYWGATGAVSVVGTNGATFYITGVQLEKGTVATSFDWRPYGTELALCQRYYEVYYSDSLNQPAIGFSTGYAGAYPWFWQFKQEKRAQATVAKVNGTYAGTTPTLYGGISNMQAYSSGIFYLATTPGQVAFSASAEL